MKQTQMSNDIKMSDFIWNFGSTAILAVGGFILSTIIVAAYNPEILGIFNEVYAYYIVLSQLAVVGINTATLKLTSEHADDERSKKGILNNSLILVAFISTILSVLIFAIINLFISDVVFVSSMKYVVLALPFFSLNKVVLGFLNGDKSMKSFAVLQAGRIVFLVAYLVMYIVVGLNPYELTSIFLMAEVTTFVISFIYLTTRKLVKLRFNKKLTIETLKFGIQIIPGNIVAEFNTKVDIICLSIITGNDYLIGIYSFATLFAEGMYQMYMIVRKLINPNITRDYYSKIKLSQLLSSLNKKLFKWRIIGSALLFVGVNIAFYVICIILNQREYLIATVSLIILSASIALNSKGIIYGNIFGQIGVPIKESKINILTMLTNMTLNVIFIPIWGILGAAIATAVSYFVFSIYQRYMLLQMIKSE